MGPICRDVFPGEFLASELSDEAFVVIHSEKEDGIRRNTGREIDLAADGEGAEATLHA